MNGVGYISLAASRLWGWFDVTIVDGLVNLSGWITGFGGRVLRQFQTGVTEQYVFMLVVALVIMSGVFLFTHLSEVSWITGFFH